MNITDYAKKELELAGWFDKDGVFADMMGKTVLKMVEEFSKEGHSGMSATIAIDLFSNVAKFIPLTPLTGEDWEWDDIGNHPGHYFQNKRCHHVFKEVKSSGEIFYDDMVKIFRYPSGGTYTSKDSRVEITFPYIPKVNYIDISED